MSAADNKANSAPRKSLGGNLTSLQERLRQVLYPQTYKANRLRSALNASSLTISAVCLGIGKLRHLLHHTTTTKDGITGLLVCLGVALASGALVVHRFQAYLRWRRGEVTMDDVSEEMEWVLEQRRKMPTNKHLGWDDFTLAFASLRSDLNRLPERWDLRKHELLKQLKRGPNAQQLLGLSGVALIEILVPTFEWAVNGHRAMWFAIGIVLVINSLIVIMWIIGDDDDLPPRPAPAKPVPTPGESIALPKMRPKVTGPKTWRS